MAKIFTDGKDQIAGGIVYRADKSGHVEIPDQVAKDEGLAEAKKTAKPKQKQPETIKFLNPED